MTRRRWRRTSRLEHEGETSLRSELLRHGHGWVAALASVAGVLVTIFIATANDGSPDPSPTPIASVLPASTAVAGPGSTTEPAAPSTTPAERQEPSGPPRGSSVIGPLTENSQLRSALAAFGLPDEQPYDEYVAVDGSERGLSVEAPAAWTDRLATNWLGGELDSPEIIGDVIIATPSERGFNASYSTPGLFLAVSHQFAGLVGQDLMEAASWSSFPSCNWAGGDDFANATYADGVYTLFWACDGEDIVILEIAAQARDGSHSAHFHLRMTSSADVDAVIHALDTFTYRPRDGAAASPPEP